MSKGFATKKKVEHRKFWLLECEAIARDSDEFYRPIALSSVFVPRVNNNDQERESAYRVMNQVMAIAAEPVNCVLLLTDGEIQPIESVDFWYRAIADRLIGEARTKPFEAINENFSELQQIDPPKAAVSNSPIRLVPPLKKLAIETLKHPGVAEQFRLFLEYEEDGEAIACRYLEAIANPPEIVHTGRKLGSFDLKKRKEKRKAA